MPFELEPAQPTGDRVRSLSQYLTPLWVAEALVQRHFADLDTGDLVLEPSCGKGAFLKALPAHVPAVGVEIDPALAAVAAAETGRRVITADFRSVSLDVSPTVVIGNPPFAIELIDQFLQRSHAMLPTGGRVGFILPAYAFQTAKRVAAYSSLWSIATELIPRNIYRGLREPLMFTLFSKDERRLMVGLALYREAADVQEMPDTYRTLMTATEGSLWRAVCRHALERLGGDADLAAIYREIEGHRPTRTRFWREQIRRTLQRYADEFRSMGAGRYCLADVLPL